MAFQAPRVTSTSPAAAAEAAQPGVALDGWRFLPDDKWKAVSHLQKCVRRGWAERAAQAVHWAWAINPAYVRYRMAVMAFEDVAGGSPDLVAASMTHGWKKDDIDAQGGVEWLAGQAHAWAASVKDRVANEWSACPRWLTDYEQRFGPIAEQSVAHALDLAWSDEPWWVRGLAAWRVAGTDRFPHERLGKFTGDWDAWIERNAQAGVSDAMLACLKAGAATQNEGSPLFLGLVERARLSEPTQETVRPVLDLGNVGPWCSASLDKHTSEGKKAITWLWNHHPEISGWFQQLGWSPEQGKDAIGRMQFWMEGGQLDRFWDYPTRQTIDRDMKVRFAQTHGINGSELYQRVGANPAIWHEARLATVPVHPAEAPTTVAQRLAPRRFGR